MALKIARRGVIPPFFVMEVMRAAFERERAGGDVLHLEVGQPSTPAPAGVIAAAKRALDRDRLGYTDALGIPLLREAISRHYGERYDLDIPARRIVVTAGSSAGFVLGFLAGFEAGDRVAMANPSYPAYRNTLSALGVQPVELDAGPHSRFQPTPAMLEDWYAEHPGATLDGLIVASPSNPAGTMLGRAELAALAEFARERALRLVSDEIYHGIAYDEPGVTALAVTDDAIVVNSFSKYFSMTGWRLGWMVVPEDLVRPIECLAQNLYISAPSLSQLAAVEAFDCRAELDRHVARYAANRALLLDQLPRAGFSRLAPADGAFYLYAEISDRTDDSEAFCRRMLAETGVAVTPGIDFDPARGHRFVRFSFAGSSADIAEAARRLQAWW
ncbi:MAG: aminotransferase class I/II-fold pyridoxal phosphate-dependent enzyme [Azospirillum sp.]|nr:aminotransferase class I/II-fold pyridoxal phosphate-dependent enzyme [Azospirillum sp.]